MIELLTWITPLPDDTDEGDVIIAAQKHRRGRGAEFIELGNVNAVQ